MKGKPKIGKKNVNFRQGREEDEDNCRMKLVTVNANIRSEDEDKNRIFNKKLKRD